MSKKEDENSKLSELYKNLKVPESFSMVRSDSYVIEIGRLIVSFQELDYWIECFIHASIGTDQNFTSFLGK